jgi:hypothetical protein
MKFVFCLLILINSVGFAETIHVQQLDDKFDVQDMSEVVGTNSKIKTIKELKSTKAEREMPANLEVIQLLNSAGLISEAKELDAFGRDELYRRAGYFPIEKLSELYPKSSKINLAKFIKLVVLQKQAQKKI